MIYKKVPLIIFFILLFLSSGFTNGNKIQPGKSVAILPLQTLNENDPKALLLRDLIEENMLYRGIYVVEHQNKKELLNIINKAGKIADSLTLAQYQLNGTFISKKLRLNCRTIQGGDYLSSIELKAKSFKKFNKNIAKQLNKIAPEREPVSLNKNIKIIIVPIGDCKNMTGFMEKALNQVNYVVLSENDNLVSLTHIIFLSIYQIDQKIHLSWKLVNIKNRRIENAWHLFDTQNNEKTIEEIVEIMYNNK